MTKHPTLALVIVLALMLTAQLGASWLMADYVGGGANGGGGGSSCSGDINAACSVVTASNGNAFTSAAFGTALNLTAPPAIGATTPSTGKFTSLGLNAAAGATAASITGSATVAGSILWSLTNLSNSNSAAAITQMLNDQGKQGQFGIRSSAAGFEAVPNAAAYNYTDGAGGFAIQTETGAGAICLATNGHTSCDFKVNTDSTLAAGTSPTTLTNAAGKILSTALNTVAIAQGGTGTTTGATSFCMGGSATIAAATTDFVACGENPGQAALTAEASAQLQVPTACTISNLQVNLTTAVNANHPVITIDKANGSAPGTITGQAVTCTVGDGTGENTTTHCADVTHTFTTTGATGAKDLLSIKVANPASANATGVMQVSFSINC